MSNRNLILAAAGAGGEPTDPNFNQTVLLLHGDGTNGAQNNTFLDSSSNTFTITRNGNTTQGTFSPFSLPNGEWSNYFDGVSDNLTFSNSAAVDFSGEFCVEFFIFLESIALDTINPSIITFPNQPSKAQIYINSANGYFAFYSGSADVVATANSSATLNTWHHLVVCRDGSNNTSIFLNGSRAATAVSSTNWNATATGTWRLMSYDGSQGDLKGYLSNCRFVCGDSVYDPTSTTLTVPTSPLSTSTTDQQLLTCYGNRFADFNTATTAKTITVGGNPSVQPFSPFAPSAAYDASVNGGSGYFDGTGDYLNTASGNNAISFGTSAYTVEAWIYQKARSDTQWICGGGGTTFQLGITSTGLVFGSVAGGANMTSSTIAVPLNSWTHVVIVRSSTSAGGVAYYINGVAAGTATDSANHSATGTVNVATTNNNGGVSPINGYMANFRVVKGSAVYTAAFTPPTAPLTAISGTSLLCNFTNAGIFDNTGKNNLETVADAQIDTTTKKYGTGSMEFDGTGDYLVLPNSPNTQVGSGAYTIEMWVKTTQAFGWLVFDADNDTGIRLGINVNGTSGGGADGLVRLEEQISNVGYSISSTTRVDDGNWHHVAISRPSGTPTRLFIDGNLEATNSIVVNLTNPNRMFIGTRGNLASFFNGFIDDLRITKGVARYTANFTPPDAPFLDQ